MLREEMFVLPGVGAGDVPVSVWLPNGPARGVVLIGHGLGVDRHHESVQKPVRMLTSTHELAVVACDLPLHGQRRREVHDAAELVEKWQSFWAKGGVQILRTEWAALLAHARERFPERSCAYFGLSLGTQYGVVFLAGAAEIAAAVLGLFGSRPPPLTPIMNAYAPRVRCPLYFVQKQNDEIHPLETSQHLFSILGSTVKTLDSSPGRHAEVTDTSLERACTFISNHIR
jgi:pimeloyl-ACP methyl ester carboxylesterase